MAAYIWEFGFDFDSTPDEGGCCPIANSPVLMNSDGTGNSLVDPTTTSFTANDTIAFNLFNITAEAEISGYVLNVGLVIFGKGAAASSTQSTNYPFSPSSNITSMGKSVGIAMISTLPNESIVSFSGLGVATVMSSSFFFTSSSTFPRWEIISPLSPVNSGVYDFSLYLDIQGPNGSMQFWVDPEMIVGGATLWSGDVRLLRHQAVIPSI